MTNLNIPPGELVFLIALATLVTMMLAYEWEWL
jgi:hypothetical protein